ncbi:Imm53 family immunity protein [Rhizobium sp. Leaf341]|uniref:Imm53 family immunity protein n=1 Tax=Rhizobium sp. Leaf341 TaxID=1736344 RepID=UPI0009E6FE39|nr:Imm53 family immunity protein [Rhizobium sp. Leaf341]
MDVLDWFSSWYEAQCDGEWEHGFGPSISTVDNPGRSLKIGVAGTDCDGRTLERITHKYEHEASWWTCWTENNVFHSAAGPLHDRSVLKAFRDWTTIVSPSLPDETHA